MPPLSPSDTYRAQMNWDSTTTLRTGTWSYFPADPVYIPLLDPSQPGTVVAVAIPASELPSDPFLALCQQIVLAHARLTSAEAQQKTEESLLNCHSEIRRQEKAIQQLRDKMEELLLDHREKVAEALAAPDYSRCEE